MLETSQARRKPIPKGSVFWRSQQGHGWRTEEIEGEEFEVPVPREPDRMKPLKAQAKERRVNPKSTPCLYLGTDRETAMAEARPWLGLQMSVGQFKITRDINVIDCSVLHGTKRDLYFGEPAPDEREKCVWDAIDHAFSEPVNSDDSTAEYAPTQVLAEVFQDDGLDGIVYKSLLGSGFNAALFDIDAASLINCFLFEPKTIAFTFQETTNPYIVRQPKESPS